MLPRVCPTFYNNRRNTRPLQFIAGLRRRSCGEGSGGPPSGARYPYKEVKKTPIKGNQGQYSVSKKQRHTQRSAQRNSQGPPSGAGYPYKELNKTPIKGNQGQYSLSKKQRHTQRSPQRNSIGSVTETGTA